MAKWWEAEVGVGVARAPLPKGCWETASMVTGLGPRERYVMRRRREGATLAELARDLGVSRERVRQINGKAQHVRERDRERLRR